ncbi:LysR family transcriptional regulator [Chitinimonas koreensis]|uniref:LysR family transcriptional regulator n=1 Tax=Chitinimonas koreensis TaxID=356302 RepID=UPI000411F19D|nr:LysR family transcriptional regulator [Chitinimonas koreensis]QNM95851.1 LysR family transcriptional regulator [Chitinimonas koreensis]
MARAELNYKHLHYFWTVAHEGGVARAAERLDVSPQTISGQLSKLERDLGRALFRQEGRRLVLTEAGREALRLADEIFLLGERLQEVLADPELGQAARLVVGIADSVPKLVAWQLLSPLVESTPNLRLTCHEGEFDELVSALSRHKLDVVLSDRDLGPALQHRLRARRVAASPIGLFATGALRARHGADLRQAPLLLPSRRSSLRARLERWLESEGLRPPIVGEFDDSALLTTFGGNGAGFFPAATVLADMLAAQYGAELVRELPELSEDYYAVAPAARLANPLVARLMGMEAA